jgi:protein involved in polysaccharide export with SLBB domain
MIKTFVRVTLRRFLQGVLPLIAVAVLVGACSSSPALPPAMDADLGATDYKLGTGDKVNMKVFGDESLSGSYQVDGKGMFSVPLVGSVEAAGLTKNQLEDSLRTKLKRYLNDPRVAVEIESYRPFYIIGEVQKPGSYNYVNGMTVINAVAIAGGFTYRAKDDAFAIRRSADRSTVEGRQMTQVQPGDVIVVRERFF